MCVPSHFCAVPSSAFVLCRCWFVVRMIVPIQTIYFEEVMTTLCCKFFLFFGVLSRRLVAPEEKQPSPVLVRRTNKKDKHENKFSASFHQLTASRGQLSFKMWCTPSFGPPPELFTQQGGTKERKRHPRFRGTRCLNCIKIHRKLTSQHNSKGLAAHLPSPFISLTASLSLMVTARPW